MKKYLTQYTDFLNKIYDDKEIRDITFQVTEDCNLKCSYCYQINKTHNRMNFETAKKFIDYIFECRTKKNTFFSEENVSGLVINFIGGEPFLEIELIEKIVEYFELKFLECQESPWFLEHIYSFTSNGTLYFTDKVQQFIRKYRHLINISITVDGNKILHDKCRIFPNGKGSYDLAIQAALEEQKHGSLGTKITLAPENVNYIFEGVVNMISLGFREISMNCCYEDVWKDDKILIEMLNQLIKLSNWIKDNDLYDKIYISLLDPDNFNYLNQFNLTKNHCGVGQGCMTALDYTGNIYPCLRFMPSSLGNDVPPIVIGNNKHGIGYTLEEKNNLEILNNCIKDTILSEECKTCSIANNCSYCLGWSYQLNKGFTERKNTICKPYKITALASKYLCKICNDINNYNNILLDYKMFKNLIEEEYFNKIVEREE